MSIELESKKFSVPKITEADLRNERDLINKLRLQQELINALVRDVVKLRDVLDNILD